LDGSTLATPAQKNSGKCQSAIVKAYDKLFSTTLKEFSSCAKIRFKAGTTEPPANCVDSNLKGKIAKSAAKLGATMGGLVWPPDPASYVFGPLSYLNSLTIPSVDPTTLVPSCCRDYGAISRDFIELGTNNIDNALAKLDNTLSSFGLNLQASVDDGLAAGDTILLLDHQFLDATMLPDDFALVALDAVFDTGTTFTEANAGLGEFLVNQSSFSGATGTPSSFFFPSMMTSTLMTAGPASLDLPLAIGPGLLDVSISDGLLDAVHAPIAAAGIDSTAGTVSGYIEVADIFAALNAILDSPACGCLGLTGSVYFQNPDGSWAASCASDTSGCTLPSEDICKTLAGTHARAGNFERVTAVGRVSGFLTGDRLPAPRQPAAALSPARRPKNMPSAKDTPLA
jgi:hypothetical protein